MAVENVQALGIAHAYMATTVKKVDGAVAKPAVSTPQSPVRAGDELALSNEGRFLAAARQAVVPAPEVREDRIAALRQRIQDGTYAVSSDQLARSMLRHAQQQQG